MELTQRLDDYGKPAWIMTMILGFIFFWPVGLAILGYMIWSGRMGCKNYARQQPGMWSAMCGSRRHNSSTNDTSQQQSSGNSAFDEYRSDTLKRLEDEFEEFQDFLEQLRLAKDKEEFDNFMASRKTSGTNGRAEGPMTES